MLLPSRDRKGAVHLDLRNLLLAFALLSVAGYAQRQMTVKELTSFIKSSVAQKNPDSQVADYIRKSIKLSEKLDDPTVEALQGLGAGPKTVAALRTLSDSTANLTPPAPPAPPATKAEVVTKPAPSTDEQKRILAQLTEYAHDYTKNLPDFICTQVTFQRVDPKGGEAWNLTGTVQEHLTYVEGHEDYKVVMVNNRPVTNVNHMQVGGNKSEGEFGSMLAEIFRSRIAYGIRLGQVDHLACAQYVRIQLPSAAGIFQIHDKR